MTHSSPKPGDTLASLSTPLPVINEDVLAGNIRRVQSYMDTHDLRFRPHIKTHKIPALAWEQVRAGASGINCQKISEADVFADAGFDDILITYNILGSEKLARLVALNERVGGLKVVADSAVTVQGLSEAFRDTKGLTVLVECDTGGGRCGVQTPGDALTLAGLIANAPGLYFGGLMTYPKAHSETDVDRWLTEAVDLLKSAAIACPIVSNGGTPSLFDAHKVTPATEHRAGTYIYNDRSMIRAGHCDEAQCAMHVIATVVARPTQDRAILDAGSKALTSDLLGFADYGLIVEYPEARITGLSEEHGTVDLSLCGDQRPNIGDRVRIIPNHTCVVSNLFDAMVFHRDGIVTRVEAVKARGMVW